MKREKLTDSALEQKVIRSLQLARATPDGALITEMVETVLKLVGDQTSRGDLKILNRALKELRYAFRVFAPYRSVRKASIFGSARVAEDDPYYQKTAEFARRLTEEGFMVITGAGPGIMQSGNEGAGREKSFGVNIRLPFEQKANRIIRGDSKLINFHFFFTRKLIFVKETDAVAFFPGGFGTHDEAIEILTLMQTGKSQIVPMVFLDLPGRGYWQEWLNFVRKGMLARGFISEEDLHFFKIFEETEAAVAEIKRFYANFHSYRFVKRDLLIRLSHAPTPGLVEDLNKNFQDALTGGTIRETDPLPEELEQPDAQKLHRILVPFNRMSFGRLRQMIDMINSGY